MKIQKTVLTGLALLAWSTHGYSQSQFYLFPVGVLDGISENSKNPALNKEIVEALTDNVTQPDVQIIKHFQGAVLKNFPQSTVTPTQIAKAATGGNYEYIDAAAGSQCEKKFRVPITASYAVVLSVTRASEYRNERAGQIDIQIPITLTLQIVKPDQGRVAYTLTDTLYSPFIFTKQEVDLPATKEIIRKKVIENINKQVDFLVAEAKKVFNPKSNEVKIIGKSGRYFVVDGGYEVGFNTKDSLIVAFDKAKPNEEIYVKIISVKSGHTIVQEIQSNPGAMGKLEEGMKLSFVFESNADDSSKPGLMPITNFDQQGQKSDLQAAMAQQFIKNLGFSSKFNIVPVNTSFKSVMDSIQTQAPCLDWKDYPAANPIKGSRTDLPQFYAKFDVESSKIYRNDGSKNVQGVSTESEEDFAIATSVSLIDSKMRIHYSEAVVEPYKIRRVNGSGLSLQSAQDVAVQNAVLKLANNFSKNAKLEVRDLNINKVEGNRLWLNAKGLTASDINAFTVYRELDVEFKGQKVLLPLVLGEGVEPVSQQGDELVISFSTVTTDTPLPRKGDKIRLEGLAKPGAINVQRCALPDFSIERSVYQPKYTHLFVEAGINNSTKLQLLETNEDVYSSIIKMLDVGNFKFESITKAKPSNLCYQVGSALRPDVQNCENGRCKATVVNGLIVRFGNTGATHSQQVQAAQKTEITNIQENQLNEFYGYSSMMWFDSLQGELKNRLQNFVQK
jgi:hypothetical protein